MTADTASFNRTKHIELRYHSTRHYIREGKITLTYTPTDEMIADMFTKPLAKHKFTKFRTMLRVHPGYTRNIEAE
jgi:KUP system potassium uptake protein